MESSIRDDDDGDDDDDDDDDGDDNDDDNDDNDNDNDYNKLAHRTYLRDESSYSKPRRGRRPHPTNSPKKQNDAKRHANGTSGFAIKRH